ncbi:hypothetical protein WA158_006074 [Blastocystis sp. Blastoise]
MKDTLLYDLFEIEPTATSSQIKKAYYRVALKYHPDKNGGDKQAAAKFQECKEAYEILSDAKKREQYDKYGYNYIKFMDDPSAMFTDPDTAVSALCSLPFKYRLLITSFFIVAFITILYFITTFGLKADNYISWSWTTVLIPVFIAMIILTLINGYGILSYIYTLIVTKLMSHQKAKSSDNEENEEDNVNNNDFFNDTSSIVDIISMISIIFLYISVISIGLALDSPNWLLYRACIPYYIYELLETVSILIKVFIGQADWSTLSDAVFSICKIFSVYRIALVHDTLVSYSYIYAILPIWIYLLIQLIKFVVMCAYITKYANPDDHDIADIQSSCFAGIGMVFGSVFKYYILCKVIGGWRIRLLWIAIIADIAVYIYNIIGIAGFLVIGGMGMLLLNPERFEKDINNSDSSNGNSSVKVTEVEEDYTVKEEEEEPLLSKPIVEEIQITKVKEEDHLTLEPENAANSIDDMD